MKILIDNMTCNHCKMRIEKALKEAGFKKFKIDVETKTLDLIQKNKSVELAKSAIEAIGYNFKIFEE